MKRELLAAQIAIISTKEEQEGTAGGFLKPISPLVASTLEKRALASSLGYKVFDNREGLVQII